MCFLVVGNVGTDIVGIRQQNIRLGGGGLSAIIAKYLRKLCY